MLEYSKKNSIKKNILINGYFFCRQLTGIERYAIEITKRLDNVSLPGEISLIIPGDYDSLPDFNNINIIRYGKTVRHIFWQFFILQYFLFTHKQYRILDFGNTCLPFFPGIIFLHDIYCEFFPEDFSGFRDKLARIYNRWQYRLIAKKARKIITVSNFTKNQLINTFNVNPGKISVIYSSWEHFKTIQPDYTVFRNNLTLKKSGYYFSLGSLSKRKNLKWISEYAKNNPESYFAISGTTLPTVTEKSFNSAVPRNITLLGYLNDSEVKALMKYCKAFILPSYYEGFGLTPLEALSCGAQVIISNAASLPEIYGNTAHYIDPNNTDINLEKVLEEPVEKPDLILKKYSYDTAAVQVYDLIKSINA